jgi:hypothetical protein
MGDNAVIDGLHDTFVMQNRSSDGVERRCKRE